MEPTFEDLIKDFGRTKKKASRVSNVKVKKPDPCREDADVHGINNLIDEMMDVDKEHPSPVMKVQSTVIKGALHDNRKVERYHSDEGELSSDEQTSDYHVQCVVSKGTQHKQRATERYPSDFSFSDEETPVVQVSSFSKGTERKDRVSQRYLGDNASSDEEHPSRVRSAVSKGAQRKVAPLSRASERYHSSEGEASSDEEPLEPFKPHHQPKDATTSTKLTVTNLALTVDQEDFDELFQEFKGVLKVVLGIDNKGQSMGTGYALFSSRGEALKAAGKYNGVPLDDKPMEFNVQPLPKPPQAKPVLKVPKRQSVFSRLTREPVKKAALKTHDTNRPFSSVFSRLSREPIVTSALEELSKLDNKMRSRYNDVSANKRYRNVSPEDRAIGSSDDEINDYQDLPRNRRDLEDNSINAKRSRHRDYESPENYGPPRPRYVDYDNPKHLERQAMSTYTNKNHYYDYDNPDNHTTPEPMFRRYVDHDNPELQDHPVRPLHTDHHVKRKENNFGDRRVYIRKGRDFGGGRQQRRGGPSSFRGPRLTTEELDAELEEMVNPTIDTDVFGH